MRTRIVPFLSAIALSLAALGCATAPARPLDLSSLPQGDIPVTEVAVLVEVSADRPGLGAGLLGSYVPGELSRLQEALVIASGMTLDTRPYRSALASGLPAPERKKVKLADGTRAVLYTWRSAESVSPRAAITVAAAMNEDGLVPVSVTLSRDDPAGGPAFSTAVICAFRPSAFPPSD